MLDYVLLLVSSFAFEFAYVGWARAAAAGRIRSTVAYSVLTAALGLVGIRGALELELGVIPYLAGIGLGAYVSAYIGSRRAAVTAA